MFQSLSQYDKASEYQEKALAITKEIGDRDGEEKSYLNLGTVCQSLSQCEALAIKTEVGVRDGEATATKT